MQVEQPSSSKIIEFNPMMHVMNLRNFEATVKRLSLPYTVKTVAMFEPHYNIECHLLHI